MSISNARTALDLSALLVELESQGWQGPIPTILDTTESTNSDVARLAAAGAAEGSCIVAEHQSAGRGRLARAWVSPRSAGLWLSILVRPAGTPRSSWGWLPLLAGLATADAVRIASGVPARVKWPNDVVILDTEVRKLGGILSEATDQDAVVVGIGLNVSMTREELPIAAASSVLLEGGVSSREILLAGILARFDARLGQWRSGDAQLQADYRDACMSIGRTVEATLPGSAVVRGTVVGVDENGQLLVDDGTTVVIVTAGDVIHATI